MYQAARRMALVISPKEMTRLSQNEKKEIEKLIENTPDPYQWEIMMNELISRYI